MKNNHKIKVSIADKPQFPPFKLLSMVDYPPFCNDKFHAHDMFQVLLVVSGSFYLADPHGNEIEAEAGEMLVIPPGKKHSWASRKKKCRTIQLIHSPMPLEAYGDLSLLFGEFNSDWRKIRIGEKPAASIAKRLQAEFRNPQPAGSMMIFALLMEIFTLALRAFCDTEENVQYRQPELAVKRALEYIQAHYREKILLEDLAKNSYLGVSRFSEIFRRHTGEAPISHINRLRMEKAKLLLAYSRMAIGEIAEHLGFESIHYFSRAFKKYFGTSPSGFGASKRKS